MNMEPLAVAASVGVGIIGAYKLGERLYGQNLASKMPEYGDYESIFPYMAVARGICSLEGLSVAFMGGPVKQAVCDPQTEFFPDTCDILVSTDPDCRTLQKATLYRPNNTIRDIDILVTGVDSSPALPIFKQRLESTAKLIQETVNNTAKSRNMPRGPEISLFGYEPKYGAFRISHYATRTHYLPNGEEMAHSLGASQQFREQYRWQLNVSTNEDTYTFPTTSPVRVLGRTLTRSLVTRERDRSEVYEGVENIKSKGLASELLGDEWYRYQNLRNTLDRSFRLENALKQNSPIAMANFLLAKAIAPLAPKIEDSYLADMMQDPDSPIFKIAAKIMGANETS